MKYAPSILIMLELSSLGDIPTHHADTAESDKIDTYDPAAPLPQQIKNFGWDHVRTMISHELIGWLADLKTCPNVLTVATCSSARGRGGRVRVTEDGGARERQPGSRVTKNRRSHDRSN